jgi:TRAP-type C4-dicarboxylate transport system substrate-binding protein
MRTMENKVHVAAYKGFGIITTPMAFPEVFTALQQGTVDGQENPLSVIMAPSSTRCRSTCRSPATSTAPA